MNAPSALTVGGPGLIGAAPGLVEEAIAVAMEAAQVGEALGVELDRDAIAEMIQRASQDHLWHRPSMRVDIDENRPTEVGSLNGYISEKGAELGIPTPRNDLLFRLIQAREMSVDYWSRQPKQ